MRHTTVTQTVTKYPNTLLASYRQAAIYASPPAPSGTSQYSIYEPTAHSHQYSSRIAAVPWPAQTSAQASSYNVGYSNSTRHRRHSGPEYIEPPILPSNDRRHRRSSMSTAPEVPQLYKPTSPIFSPERPKEHGHHHHHHHHHRHHDHSSERLEHANTPQPVPIPAPRRERRGSFPAPSPKPLRPSISPPNTFPLDSPVRRKLKRRASLHVRFAKEPVTI
ncbi:hypothetical protein DL96DRAFT_322358 [Flagelloscypha sp. PMI_526]|nr:hypothetical protein DL96DRAFT_322358 [Flagelloscypha sp. PMI_526]